MSKQKHDLGYQKRVKNQAAEDLRELRRQARAGHPNNTKGTK